MRSWDLPRKLFVQLILVVLHVSFIKGGKLDFYQDDEPELPLDVNYEQMARYLEAQKHANIRDNVHQGRMSPNLPWPYDEYFDYTRQKEKKILEALLENPSILDVLEHRKLNKERDEIQQLPPRYDIREDMTRAINEPEEPRPYMNVDPMSSRFDDYTNVRIPYAKSIFRNQKPYFAHGPNYPMRMPPPENENYPSKEKAAELLMELERKLKERNEDRGNMNEDKPSPNIVQEPEFTFKFDPVMTNERNPFAVNPNDPRYYEDDTSTQSVVEDEPTTSYMKEIIEKSQEVVDQSDENEKENKIDVARATDNIRTDKFSMMKIVHPKTYDEVEEDDRITTSTRMILNGTDIYFIAIVAGCSAAAMFALVLISLTWCRLHRGAKAAADIEYPAYGVTGPNKDVSPSGDQRLAHSAQMYHFQHQKQQIIAMEKTAASRDPGSVSEAESDEENEEGDYTVYECPGLASAGEMEVKNPLFHDDPTPATPPQIHKEEDHI